MPLSFLLVSSQRSGHVACKSLKEPTLFEGSTTFSLEPIRDPSKTVNESSFHLELPAGPVLLEKDKKAKSLRMYSIYSRSHRSPNFILGFLYTILLQYFYQKKPLRGLHKRYFFLYHHMFKGNSLPLTFFIGDNHPFAANKPLHL